MYPEMEGTEDENMPSMSTSLDENKIEIKTEAPTGKNLKKIVLHPVFFWFAIFLKNRRFLGIQCFERIYSLCCTPGWDKFKIFRNSEYILFSSKDREETHKIMIWLSIFIDIHSFYLCNRYKEMFFWLILNLWYWPSNFICPGEKNLLNRVDKFHFEKQFWQIVYGCVFTKKIEHRFEIARKMQLISHFRFFSSLRFYKFREMILRSPRK